MATGHTETRAALAELSALIADAPGEPRLHRLRAAFHEEAGDWAAARADLQAALSLDPDHRETLTALGRLELATGSAGAARAAFDALLRQTPDDPGLLILRARAGAKSGEAAAAYTDYSGAIDRLPEPRPELYLERAALPVAPAVALAGLDAGIARIGPAITLHARALQLELQLGRTPAALRRVDLLTAAAERKDPWLRRRGDILAGAGRATEARAAYAAALAAFAELPAWLRAAPALASVADELTRLAQPAS